MMFHRNKTLLLPFFEPCSNILEHLADNHLAEFYLKKIELESKLKLLGWYFERHGGKHDV